MRPVSDREHRGQALVEFALVIPIFLLLVFGMMDMGRFVYMHSTLSQAAREGARLGAVEAYWVGSTDPSCNTSGGPVCPANLAALRTDVLAAANRMMTPFGNIAATKLYTSCDATTAPSGNWTTQTCLSNQPGQLMSVRVEYTIQPMTPIINAFFPSITSTASATMVIN
jgi:Flp pilus assembly protein TadG